MPAIWYNYGIMRKGAPKPVQFSLQSLFLVTFAVSAVLATVASLRETAVALLVPLLIATDLCRRALRGSPRAAGASLAAAWLSVIALLSIATVVWLAGL